MYGYIYRVVNRLDGKCYIGQTITPVKSRIKQHLLKVNKEIRSPFHNAIFEFGKENFDVYVIATISGKNSKELRDLLKQLENYYIDLFKSNSTEFGYNITMNKKFIMNMSEKTERKKTHKKYKRKPVKQFDLDGNLICEYKGVSEAERLTGINKGNIYNCLTKRGNCSVAGGYKWTY